MKLEDNLEPQDNPQISEIDRSREKALTTLHKVLPEGTDPKIIYRLEKSIKTASLKDFTESKKPKKSRKPLEDLKTEEIKIRVTAYEKRKLLKFLNSKDETISQWVRRKIQGLPATD